MSTTEKIRIIVAAMRHSRRKTLCQKLSEHIPQAILLSVPSPEAMLEALRSDTPQSVVLSSDICTSSHNPEFITKTIRQSDPGIHILWILPRQVNTAHWLDRAQAGSFDILVQPVHGLELAQRCLCALGDAPRLHLANKRLTDLARQRAKSLYESDERYRLLLNSCSDGIMVAQLEREGDRYKILEVNNSLCQLLAYPRDEFMRLQPKDIVESHRVKYINARMDSLQTYRHIFFETVLVSRDGRKVPVGTTARLFSADQSPYVIFLFRLPETYEAPPPGIPAQAYHTMVRQTGQAIYEYTLATKQIRVDGATRQLTGYTSAQIEALERPSLLQLIHEDDRRTLLSVLARAAEELGPYELRYRILHATGELRYVEDAGIVLTDEAGRAARFLGSIKDVTERVRVEEERRQAEQAIQHSKRLESLGVLAGGIAHDFNNILAAIIGLTDLSIQELEGANPEVLEDLNESLGAAHRAKDLIKQILVFSRQSGEEHTPLHLHIVVREALGLLRVSLPSNIKIIDSVDPRSGMVMANATQMHQVVMNCCTNGLQSMSEKGGILELRLENTKVTQRFADTHPKLRPGSYVKLTVADRGHGMEQNVVRRIFDPFFTTKEPGKGTGMGLAMVYGIIANHGGAILVDSALGQGTTFSTYLPQIESTPQEGEVPDRMALRGTERVLVVDDDASVRRFCERALSQLGYTVSTEGHPAHALAICKDNPQAFDVIITDHHMPEMTGLDLSRRITKLQHGVPVLLFTGFSQNVDKVEAQEAGIREIISKPLEAAQLAGTLRRILDDTSHTTGAEKDK